MMADISRRGPLPVLESAVRIHENPKVDLDITLSRGIVVFKNLKDQGAGKVTVRFRGQTWNITLKDPGALVGMEIYGRYCGGCRKFLDKSGEKTRADVMPSFTVFLLVREGHATIHTRKQELAMDEPPGPALLQWDSDDNEAEVTRLHEVTELRQHVKIRLHRHGNRDRFRRWQCLLLRHEEMRLEAR